MTEDATSRVAIVLNRDLMFGSRIRSTLRALDLDAHVVKNTAEFIAAMQELGDAGAIGIVDMNGPVDWDALGDALAQDTGFPPTLGFGAHVDVETRRAAKAARVSRIVSTGEFHRDMAALITRYRRS